MFSKKDLDKTTMYEAVKSLLEEEAPHLHLDQQKLFTLFSIAFQYILFRSTKYPGHYIIRIEDSFLADKLARKAKERARGFTWKRCAEGTFQFISDTYRSTLAERR